MLAGSGWCTVATAEPEESPKEPSVNPATPSEKLPPAPKDPRPESEEDPPEKAELTTSTESPEPKRLESPPPLPPQPLTKDIARLAVTSINIILVICTII